MRYRTRCAVRWPRRPAPERWLRVPIDFHIDRSRGLVVTEAVGTVDVADIAEHIKRLTNTPDRPPREIADFSSQVRLTLAPAVARSAARALAAVDGGDEGSRLALVARSDGVFATLRVFGAHRQEGGLEVRVFREREPALRWLGVAPDAGQR